MYGLPSHRKRSRQSCQGGQKKRRTFQKTIQKPAQEKKNQQFRVSLQLNIK